MAPPEGVGGRIRCGVGQHRQHEGLGVPERVPVIPRPGQPFRRDRPALCARPGLQDVKQPKTHGLLNCAIAVKLDIGACPEPVEVAALLGQQPLPTGLHGTGQRRVGLVANCRQRPGTGPPVRDDLDEPQPLPGFQSGGHHRPTQVGEAFGLHQRARRPIDDVVHHHGHYQGTFSGGMHQTSASAPRGIGLFDQWLRQRRSPSRIPAGHGKLLVGDQLGLHHDPRRLVDRLHLIADRRDRALRQRHHSGGGDLDPRARRRDPLGLTAQYPGPEIEAAFMGTQFAVANIERFVVDQQPHDLAVGHIDDRLPGLGIAVAAFRIRQRPDFEDTIEIGARQAVRLTLVQVPAPTDVAVGQCEH